mgnify:CR=1 FL=1
MKKNQSKIFKIVNFNLNAEKVIKKPLKILKKINLDKFKKITSFSLNKTFINFKEKIKQAEMKNIKLLEKEKIEDGKRIKLEQKKQKVEEAKQIKKIQLQKINDEKQRLELLEKQKFSIEKQQQEIEKQRIRIEKQRIKAEEQKLKDETDKKLREDSLKLKEEELRLDFLEKQRLRKEKLRAQEAEQKSKDFEREQANEEKKKIKDEKQRLKEIQINAQKAEQQRLDEEERKLQYQELKLKEAEQNIKDIEDQRLRTNEIIKLKESEELCRKAIELKPDFVDAYRNLGDTLKRLDKFDDAIMSYNKAITLNPNFIEVYNLLGVTFNLIDKHEEAEKNFNKAIELKPDYEEAHVNLSVMLRQNKILKKILNFRKEKKIDKKLINTNSSVSSSNMLTSNPFISSRFVEAELINNLYEINSKSLDKTNGVFFGKGRHSSDFDLFKSNYPIIKTVEEDLINVMKQAVNSEVQIIDSFFNILGAGGGSNPHHHLNSFDKVNKLIYQKYSLTYYLSVGDQNCNEPGLLKLKDPDEEILPSVGMIMIFPANRTHSAVYGGKTDRVMIGINFYSII